MVYPETFPIAHEPGYHTDTIGRWARGQYFGNVIQIQDDMSVGHDPAQRHWYAYLHEFQPDGTYIESTIQLAGIGPAARHDAERLLADWLDGLPERHHGDIAIKPFQVEHDGIVFGLVLEDHDGIEWAELYPDRLGLSAPWDGTYDT